MNRRFYMALLPWLCFAIVDRYYGGLGPEWAAVAALVTVAVVALITRARPRLAALDLVAVVLFAAVAGLSHLLPAAVTAYNRAVVVAVLAAALAISLLGRPLTTVYLQEALPPARWADPVIDRLNRRLTAKWALVGMLSAASLTAGIALGGRDAATVLDWLVPLLAVVAGAVSGPSGPDTAGEDNRQTLALFDGLVGSGPAGGAKAPAPHLRALPDPDPDQRQAG